MSFRLALAPLLRTCAWLAGVLWAVTVGVEALGQYRTGAFPAVPALLRVMALPLGLGALLALVDVVMVLAYPVRVLPEGLRAFNAWGVYKTVKWGDIPSVSMGSFLRMRYLRVPVPASAWPMTVPLALRDLPGFVAAIEQHAGPEHALAVAVRLAVQARSEEPLPTAAAAAPKVEL